jgi:hypothetical protein
MGSRYASAHQEIQAILQREPHLTAKEVWHQMTDSWPVPPVRTVSRYMKLARLAMASVAKSRKPNSASVEGPDGLLTKEFRMATADEKLDSIASHLDSLHTKIDSMGESCKKTDARLDALEADREKQKADSEREEKAKADAAKRRADAASDSHAYADAQMRCDSAFQAWGKMAPHALHGESLRDFRIRLLSALKVHSRAYGDSDLATVGDEAVFSNIEGIIIKDAIEASNSHADTPGVLRQVTSRDNSGRQVTRFYGDPAVAWGEFMGGTRFGKIVRPPAH